MTINEFMAKMELLREKVGGDNEIMFVSTLGENDAFAPEYMVAGDYEDCNGREYKCAVMLSPSGDEFTKKGTPHYSWEPSKDAI